jgi:hypothetical protein
MILSVIHVEMFLRVIIWKDVLDVMLVMSDFLMVKIRKINLKAIYGNHENFSYYINFSLDIFLYDVI